MLQNAYFLAKIGADTAENEQHFAQILPKIGNYPPDANSDAYHSRLSLNTPRHAAPAAARARSGRAGSSDRCAVAWI